MNPFVSLARQSIAYYLEHQDYLPLASALPSALLQTAGGVFVSLKTKTNDLRGCIGTYLPAQPNLALEIINNAVAAATADPRFNPLSLNELADLKISVDILSQPEKISDLSKLNPRRYGVIVQANDGRQGLLLPDLEGVETVGQQVAIACQKAGLRYPQEKISVQRFTVTRYQ